MDAELPSRLSDVSSAGKVFVLADAEFSRLALSMVTSDPTLSSMCSLLLNLFCLIFSEQSPSGQKQISN